MAIRTKFDIIQKKPSELIPYTNNPKTHPDKQVDGIANSIHEFDFDVPIVIDNHNVIIKGHGRWQAALKLNLKAVPVIVRDDLTPVQVKLLRIADNKVAESPWDYALLGLEFTDITSEEIDILLSGFDMSEIQEIMQYGEKPGQDEWANYFEQSGNTTQVDGYEQITFVLPTDDLARLKEYLKTLDKNKNVALVRMLDICGTLDQ